MVHNRLNLPAVFSLSLVFILVSCEKKTTQPVPTQINGVRETEVFNTVVAQFTEAAVAVTPTPPPPPTPTTEIIPPSTTPIPSTLTEIPLEPTTTSQATPTQQSVMSGVRIWWDDFEVEKMWFAGTKEDSYTFEFFNGAYRMFNNLIGSIVWSIRGDSYTDIRLEVDAMKQDGPIDGYYGLICRYVDAKNYYALVIGDGGTFGMVKMEKSKLIFIQQGELPAEVLKAKGEYNRIRADCIGSSLILYVNDKKVTEIQDTSFTTGDVGIGVGNQLEAAGIDVIFDNFEIWQP